MSDQHAVTDRPIVSRAELTRRWGRLSAPMRAVLLNVHCGQPAVGVNAATRRALLREDLLDESGELTDEGAAVVAAAIAGGYEAAPSGTEAGA